MFIGLIGVFLLGTMSISIADKKEDVFSETKEKLGTISEKEQEILQQLFFILQDIEEMERQEIGLQESVKKIEEEIQTLTKHIEEEETIYEKKKDTLKEVLKIYQRRGITSFFEIILTSDNFSSLIRRINIVRDLSRNTGALLEELDEKKKSLEIEKQKLDDRLYTLKEKQEELSIALLKNKSLKNDLEAYLASLNTQRSYYEEELVQIEKAWEEIKKSLIDSIERFSHVLAEGNLPFEKVKVTFTLGGVKGTMDEETFNQIAKEYLVDQEIEFHFYENRMNVEIPNKHFSLSGSFVIVDDHTLRFIAKEGSFCGLALSTPSIEEIFKDGQLQLNLEPVLYGSKLEAATIRDGYLEIISKVSFF